MTATASHVCQASQTTGPRECGRTWGRDVPFAAQAPETLYTERLQLIAASLDDTLSRCWCRALDPGTMLGQGHQDLTDMLPASCQQYRSSPSVKRLSAKGHHQTIQKPCLVLVQRTYTCGKRFAFIQLACVKQTMLCLSHKFDDSESMTLNMLARQVTWHMDVVLLHFY